MKLREAGGQSLTRRASCQAVAPSQITNPNSPSSSLNDVSAVGHGVPPPELIHFLFRENVLLFKYTVFVGMRLTYLFQAKERRRPSGTGAHACYLGWVACSFPRGNASEARFYQEFIRSSLPGRSRAATVADLCRPSRTFAGRQCASYYADRGRVNTFIFSHRDKGGARSHSDA